MKSRFLMAFKLLACIPQTFRDLFKGKPGRPVYSVLINGRNFLIDIDGREEKHGFYLRLFIEAEDAEAAELEAVRSLKSDSHLKQVARNPKEDSPLLFADEIYLVKRTKRVISRIGARQGIAWYSEAAENGIEDVKC